MLYLIVKIKAKQFKLINVIKPESSRISNL